MPSVVAPGRSRPIARSHADDGLAEDRRVAVDQRLLLQRNPQIRRIAAQRFAEESRRRHADDGERVALDDERGADDRWIAAVGALPDVVAQHDDRRRRRRVVRGAEHAAAERTDAKRREIVAGHVLGPQRPRRRLRALPSHAEARAAGLKGRDLFELRQLGLQPLEQRKREHPPAILRAALHAAGVAVADAVEARGVADRQRAQHDRVDEREDGRGAANAERERQHRRDGEDARHPELTQRVTKFADEDFPKLCSPDCCSSVRAGLDGGRAQFV